MKHSGFTFPLGEDVFGEFCAPGPDVFDGPCRHGVEICAGNGYVAIRCHSGKWLDSEYPDASKDFLLRLCSLPWMRGETLPDGWRTLERGPLLGRGELALWGKNGKLSSSPVWRVGGAVVRLSMLQLIARLPRCEVNWFEDRDTPLFFRFGGGRGIIARDERLTLWSHAIFQPQMDVMTGAVVVKNTCKGNWGKPPEPEPVLEGWPPEEELDL